MSKCEGLRRFLAPAACRLGQTVALPAQQSRHAATVLRLAEGDTVRLFTGQGREFIGRIIDAKPDEVRVLVLEDMAAGAELPVRIVLGFAPAAGARTDTLIEKATELGAAHLQPIVTARTQGQRARAAAARVGRWRRKAQQAARQSQRTVVPSLGNPLSFERFLASASGTRIIAADPTGKPLLRVLANVNPGRGPVFLAVGPAGGFTEHEIERASQCGFAGVSLGRHVLRVETAAMTLLATVSLWLDAARRSV